MAASDSVPALASSRSADQRFHLYVLTHSDETLASVPVHRNILPVDLRTLDLEARWASNQYAESRFLLSGEGAGIESDFVGLASARFAEKWPNEPSLEYLAETLPRSRLLSEARGLAPRLTKGDWIAASDGHHPGMGVLLRDLIAAHRLRVGVHAVPQANTFVCSRSAFLDLRDFVRAMLTEVVGQYGEDIPFQYRCVACGHTDHDRVGRSDRSRHVGFLAERLTMLYFAQRDDIRFLPTRAVWPKVRVRLEVAAAQHALRAQLRSGRRRLSSSSRSGRL